MSSIVDSEAQFDLRSEQVNVPAPLRAAVKNAGITTIASLAYAHGQPLVNDDFTNWVSRLDPTASVGGVASLKRLLFESQTQLMAALRDQITNPEPSTAKKVPQANVKPALQI